MKQVMIFTDGSSRGNPGPGGWGAVVVEDGRVQELGGREDRTTNNRMELTAALEALKKIEDGSSHVVVYTDSNYLINGITKWIFGWQRGGWITKSKDEVVNRDIWEALLQVVRQKKIEWKYVGGHVGIAGNERCDEIATMYADNESVDLYRGSLDGYGIDINNITIDESKLKTKSASKSRSGVKAFSYLSKLDGKIMKHATWAECEARVKGKSGAKFKKAVSREEEDSIISDWSK